MRSLKPQDTTRYCVTPVITGKTGVKRAEKTAASPPMDAAPTTWAEYCGTMRMEPLPLASVEILHRPRAGKARVLDPVKFGHFEPMAPAQKGSVMAHTLCAP